MICKITPKIYISGMDEVKDFASLKELGVTAVLNVGHDCNDPLELAFENILMIKVGLTDDDLNPDFMKSLAIVALDGLIENGHTVLVHCVAGASRSPYIVFRYLAEKEHRAIENYYDEFLPKFPHMFVSPLNYHHHV